MQRFTLKDLAASKCAHLNGHILQPDNKPAKGKKRQDKHRSKAKDWISANLAYWCNENVLELKEEHEFHPCRKYRFDWAIPALMMAVEFEGGIFQKNSGHNTAKHYTKDTDKYNLAASMGWKVYRYTALNYKDVITDLNEHLNKPKQ